LGRAKQLAAKMARALNDEDVADVTIAVALLTSGVIHQYADNKAKAGELIENIRRLEDRFICKSSKRRRCASAMIGVFEAPIGMIRRLLFRYAAFLPDEGHANVAGSLRRANLSAELVRSGI
jgi:hypothetical protein